MLAASPDTTTTLMSLPRWEFLKTFPLCEMKLVVSSVAPDPQGLALPPPTPSEQLPFALCPQLRELSSSSRAKFQVSPD